MMQPERFSWPDRRAERRGSRAQSAWPIGDELHNSVANDLQRYIADYRHLRAGGVIVDCCQEEPPCLGPSVDCFAQERRATESKSARSGTHMANRLRSAGESDRN
jgi:hypothetical protein